MNNEKKKNIYIYINKLAVNPKQYTGINWYQNILFFLPIQNGHRYGIDSLSKDTNILMSCCYRSYKHFQLRTNLPLQSWWANHAEYSMGLAHKRQQSHKKGFQVNLLLYTCFSVNIFFEIEIFFKNLSNFPIFCSDFKMS